MSGNVSWAAQPFPQPSLDALALAETLAHLRAAGEEPRLSQLLAALRVSPDAAGPLADALLADADNMAEVDDADYADDESAASVARMAAHEVDADERMAALSPGTHWGIAAIFGKADAPITPTPMDYARWERDERDERDERPTLVAERLASYQARAENEENGENEESGEVQAGSGLLDLARSRGFDAEALAAQIMLTQAAIQWLDAIALPRERQPDALVSHLVGALGVERARVRAALAAGEPLDAADASASLADLLTRHGSLSVAQRDYWVTLPASTT